MTFERHVLSKENEIRNSVWRCDQIPTLITLHDLYILLEDVISETVIFYKDIVTIKKSIETVHWDGYNDGGIIKYYKLILKTAAEDFTLSAELSPSVIDNDLYSQIINKITEKIQYDEHFMKICRNCGKKHYSDDDNYCGQCGTKLPEIANYCPECERTFENASNKFCTRCGTKLVVKPAPQPPTGNLGREPEPPEPPQLPTGNLGGEPEPPESDEDFIRGLINESGKIPLGIYNPRGGAIIIGEDEFIDYSDKTNEELLTLLYNYIKNKNIAVENQDTLEKEHAVRHIKSIKKELKKRNVEMPIMASKADSNYNE